MTQNVIDHIDNPIVEDVIVAIRSDKRLGRGSCSTFDECYTDSELREWVCNQMAYGDVTADALLKRAVETEGYYWDHVDEQRGWFV